MLVGLPIDSQYSADRPKWTAFVEDPVEEGTQTKKTEVFASAGMAYILEANLAHERLSMELDGSLWNWELGLVDQVQVIMIMNQSIR